MSAASNKRISILISGRGSNMEAFLAAQQQRSLSGNVVRVISNRPSAAGLQTAKAHGIPTAIVDHTLFDSRESFDEALANVVAEDQPDAVVLAGFMRILTPIFINRFAGKLLNIHPSLLPKYPGLNTHKRAIENGDSEGGATVHYVTNELDGGPPILQARVPIRQNDTDVTLAARILEYEHKIFPEAVNWHLEGRLYQHAEGAVLDGKKLSTTGAQWSSAECI